MRETGCGLLHSRKSSAGLNRRSRRHHAGFGAPQCGNPAHTRVDAVQAVTVESDRQKILEIKHHQSVQSVQCRADKKGPLLALAREIPEDYKDSSDKTINDQIKGESALASLMRQCVHKFGNAQPEDEANAGAAH